MAKRRRKKKKKRRHDQLPSSPEKGFDFGEQPDAMAVTDFDFIQPLMDAGVFACAYGEQRIVGFPSPIPVVTLVGENPSAFEKAFEHFARWGCQEDGDAVDIIMLLKRDGTYEMWIGPEVERSMYRILPQADLCRPMMFFSSWIKQFDSTHPMVHELKRYCESAISPVVVGAAIGNKKQTDPSQIEPIQHLPEFIKFELKIIEEGEDSVDPRFNRQNRQYDSRRPPPKRPLSPREYRSQRRQTFDVAFPVSRERIRRSGLLKSVRELPGFADVSETQVIQAAINLMLSAEMVPGDYHYSKITEELPKKLWDHINSRHETANGEVKPADQMPALLAHQIELDVRHVLKRQGGSTTKEDFVKLQASFKRKGYIDD